MKMNRRIFLAFSLIVMAIWLTPLRAQVSYVATLMNDTKVSDSEYQFDVYLQSTGVTPLDLNAIQLAIAVNPSLRNEQVLTASIVAGSSELLPSQVPSAITYDAILGLIKVSPQSPIAPGTLIAASFPGTRICRLKISAAGPFGYFKPNAAWYFGGYPTSITANVGGLGEVVTNQANHSTDLLNPQYGLPASLPTSYAWAPSTTVPIGWSNYAMGSLYTAASNFVPPTESNAGKFDNTGDYLLVYFNEPADTFSVYLRGFASGTAPTVGTFLIQESTDGIIFSTISTITNKNNSWEQFIQILNPSSRFLRLLYSLKTTGNIGIDNAYLGPLAASPSAFDFTGGGTYCFGQDPGTAGTATLSGSENFANTTYQLYMGSAPVGSSVQGTGSALVWNGLPAGSYSVMATNNYGSTQMNGTVTVAESNLQGSAVATNPLCNGDANGSLDFSLSGGLAPVDFLWSNGTMTEDLTNVPAGSYGLTVTDGAGCTAVFGPWTLTDPNPISIVATPVNVSCYGQSNGAIDILATGGSEHLVTYVFPGSVGSIEPSSQVIACFQFCQTCVGGWCYQMIYPNGNLGPCVCIREYTGNNYNPVERTSLPAGDYTVFAYDTINGCYAYVPVVITQPEPISIVATPTSVTCNGASDGSIDVVATGGSGHLVTYVFPGTITEIEPSDNVIACFTFCQSCAGWCYQMLYPNGNLGPCVCIHYYDPNFNNPVERTNLPAGNYSVLAYDTINGCYAFTPVVISEPAPLTVTVTPEVLSSGYNTSEYGFADGSAVLAISGGTPLGGGAVSGPVYHVAFQSTTEDLSNGAILQNLAAGAYSLTVTDANGCSAVAAFTITQPAPAPITVNGTVSNVSCFGACDGQISLNVAGGVPPYVYVWADGNQASSITNLCPGTYTVSVFDSTGDPVFPFAWDYTATAETHSILVVMNGIQVNGSPIETGDYIGVFFNRAGEMVCGGYNQVTGTETLFSYVTAFGDDNLTPLKDGFSSGEPFMFKVWKQSTGSEVDVVPSYASDMMGMPFDPSGLFYPNGLSAISELSGNQTSVPTPGSYASSTFAITEPAPVSVSATPVHVTCHGGSDGSIDIVATGGSEHLVAVVFPGSVGSIEPSSQVIACFQLCQSCIGGWCYQVIYPNGTLGPCVCIRQYTGSNYNQVARTNLPAGDYTVFAYDTINGCYAYVPVVIEEPAPITVVATPNPVSCHGQSNGSVVIEATGGSGHLNTFVFPGSVVNVDPSDNVIACFQFCQSCTGWCYQTGPNGVCVCVTNANGGLSDPMDRTALPAGDYVAVAIDSIGGCAGMVPFTITQPDPISLTTTTTSVSCHGGNNGSVTVGVTGGSGHVATFVLPGHGITVEPSNNVIACFEFCQTCTGWCYQTGPNGFCVCVSNASGTPFNPVERTALPAGDYTVVAIDSVGGCIASVPIVITEPDPVVISATPHNVSCYGVGNGAIDAQANGGTQPYQFAWSNGSQAEDLAGLIPGTYSLTVTDANGCIVSAQAVVSQPLPLYASITKTHITCHGASTGALDFAPGGGTLPYSYLWSNQATTEDLNGVPAGTYSVTLTDANGCTFSLTAVLSEAPALISTYLAEPALCNGSPTGSIDLQVQGATPPFTYLWNTFAVSQDISQLFAGVYTVTITDLNLCQFTVSIPVGQPGALVLSIEGTDTSAPGLSDGAANLTVTGGTLPYGYVWNTGAVTEDIGGLPMGTYAVTVTDAHGCLGMGSVEIEETPLLPASWNITPGNLVHQIDIPANAVMTWFGQALVAGDFIGVFFDHGAGEVCGGYVKWEGNSTVLNAYGDPAGISGFLTGDQFRWKVWVESNLTAFTVSANYQPVGGSITHTNLFASGGHSAITGLTAYQTQSITFNNNWFISTYLIPNNPNMAAIMAPNVSQIVFVKDEDGNTYWPTFGINSIGNWKKNKAYQVKLQTPGLVTLSITGLPLVPQNEVISLRLNWNYLGYNRQAAAPIATMLAPISSQLRQVKNSLGQIYMPANSYNFFGFNSIGNMVPGQGYYLRMGSAMTFTYPANTVYATPAKSEVANPVHFVTTQNTGRNMTLGIPENAWDRQPLAGDEIGIFNLNGQLVGSGVYCAPMSMITIWGSDAFRPNEPGMEENTPYLVKFWSSSSNTESEVMMQFAEGDGRYLTDAIHFAASIKTLEQVAENGTSLGQNFPNPFSQNSRFELVLSEASHVSIEIINVLGEKVGLIEKGYLPAGTHVINLQADQLNSGAYFYVLNANGLRLSRVMNVVR